MSRILRLGPQAYGGALFILLLALALPLGCVIAYGEWLAALKAIGVLVAGYGLVVLGVSRTRIVYSEKAIRFRYYVGLEESVPFSEIYASRAEVLADRNHPMCLHIYGDTGEVTDEGEAVTFLLQQIRLKAFRREDIAWLLSQPELKVVRDGD